MLAGWGVGVIGRGFVACRRNGDRRRKLNCNSQSACDFYLLEGVATFDFPRQFPYNIPFFYVRNQRFANAAR
jgi:hypothetical protein